MMWFGGGGWWMGITMLAFWAGVILLIVWAVRSSSNGGSPTRGSRAMEILEERFARGEIDREEFEQRRSALEGR